MLQSIFGFSACFYMSCSQLQGSASSLLQTVARDEDMSWAKREQQALGRVPSRGGSCTLHYSESLLMDLFTSSPLFG